MEQTSKRNPTVYVEVSWICPCSLIFSFSIKYKILNKSSTCGECVQIAFYCYTAEEMIGDLHWYEAWRPEIKSIELWKFHVIIYSKHNTRYY